MIVPSVGGNTRGLNALPVVQAQPPVATVNPTEQITPILSESELKQVFYQIDEFKIR